MLAAEDARGMATAAAIAAAAEPAVAPATRSRLALDGLMLEADMFAATSTLQSIEQQQATEVGEETTPFHAGGRVETVGSDVSVECPSPLLGMESSTSEAQSGLVWTPPCDDEGTIRETSSSFALSMDADPRHKRMEPQLKALAVSHITETSPDDERPKGTVIMECAQGPSETALIAPHLRPLLNTQAAQKDYVSEEVPCRGESPTSSSMTAAHDILMLNKSPDNGCDGGRMRRAAESSAHVSQITEAAAQALERELPRPMLPSPVRRALVRRGQARKRKGPGVAPLSQVLQACANAGRPRAHMRLSSRGRLAIDNVAALLTPSQASVHKIPDDRHEAETDESKREKTSGWARGDHRAVPAHGKGLASSSHAGSNAARGSMSDCDDEASMHRHHLEKNTAAAMRDFNALGNSSLFVDETPSHGAYIREEPKVTASGSQLGEVNTFVLPSSQTSFHDTPAAPCASVSDALVDVLRATESDTITLKAVGLADADDKSNPTFMSPQQRSSPPKVSALFDTTPQSSSNGTPPKEDEDNASRSMAHLCSPNGSAFLPKREPVCSHSSPTSSKALPRDPSWHSPPELAQNSSQESFKDSPPLPWQEPGGASLCTAPEPAAIKLRQKRKRSVRWASEECLCSVRYYVPQTPEPPKSVHTTHADEKQKLDRMDDVWPQRRRRRGSDTCDGNGVHEDGDGVREHRGRGVHAMTSPQLRRGEELQRRSASIQQESAASGVSPPPSAITRLASSGRISSFGGDLSPHHQVSSLQLQTAMEVQWKNRGAAPRRKPRAQLPQLVATTRLRGAPMRLAPILASSFAGGRTLACERESRGRRMVNGQK